MYKRQPDGAAPDSASLARLAGIAEGWWDLSGAWHPTPEDTRRALLRALGLPAEHAAESLARLAEEAARPLPFAQILPALGGGQLRLGPALTGQRVELVLADAAGNTRPLAFPAEAGVAEPLVLPDGRVVASRRVPLPPLPAGRYTLSAGDTLCRLTVAPAFCHRPPGLRAANPRAWGIAAQLYSLRRPDDAGVGDFTTLAQLVRGAAGLGAATIGLNPLHALFPADRERASPYQPSDRRFLDPIYIDVAAAPLPVEAPALRAALAREAPVLAVLGRRPQVAWREVWAAKSRVLEAAFAAFRLPPDFAAFVREGGPALRDFARFQAIAEARGEADWRRWPAELRTPASPAVAVAAPEKRVLFHQFLQYLADRQLAAAAPGLSVGLYRDLAVGAAPDGAEAWAAGDALLAGVSVGAPPDPLGPEGQVWGLPPPDPRAMLRRGFADQAALLAANMRHAGALRIDHAMGLARLFVVPDGARGAEGTYLAMPFAGQLAQVTLESTRARCLVVGEDLGTVPDGFRETLARAEVLSYQVLRFAQEDSGQGSGLRPPARWPALAAACAATHDVATLRGWWEEADIDERAALGLLDAAGAEAERAARARERDALLARLRAEGIDPTDLLVAVHTLLARTPCELVLVQADDLAGELHAVNLPGTDRERPNWRRRLAPPLPGLLQTPEAHAVFDALRRREGSAR